MLVLSRKTNEAICIDANVYITVLAIHGGKVRLGVEAPRDVSIRREELQNWNCAAERHVSNEARLEAIG